MATNLIGLIIVGNSGVGKTFLVNVLLGEDKYLHKVAPRAVTTKTEFDTLSINEYNVAIFNIPGLIESNQEAIERNKIEIDLAFSQCPTSFICYVFGNQGGRIRDEDVIAFEALDKAYDLKDKSLCFIVNQLPSDRPGDYEGETTVYLQEVLKLKELSRVAFINQVPDVKDKNSQSKIRGQLVELISQCLPTHKVKKQDIRLLRDELKELKAEYKRKQEDFENTKITMQQQIKDAQTKYDELKNLPPKEVHHYHETVVEKQHSDGGCIIL